MTYVFVSYLLLPSLFENIAKIFLSNRDATVIVVDNSPEKEAAAIHAQLNRDFPDVTYLKSTLNNRFYAYNLVLDRLSTEWTTFRTDDDRFEEDHYLRAVAGHSSDYLYGRHSYDTFIEEVDGPYRPIETIIFKTRTLQKLAPFDLEPSSDWKLLHELFTTPHFEGQLIDEVMMHKRVHGR